MSGNNGLILTRRCGEKIHLNTDVDEEIIITYLGLTREGQAKIGIKAPLSINIVREELLALVPELTDVVPLDENRGNR